MLVVAAAGDPVAGLLSNLARQDGRSAVVMTHADAARLFSIAGSGNGMTVDPDVPMLLRPPMPAAPGRDADSTFLDGETFGALWAAAALAASPVINRPTVHGFEGGWSPSAAVTERRAALPVASELYLHLPPGAPPPDGRTWAIEDARGRTRRWTALDRDDIPCRARALIAGEAYERVIVLDGKAWRSTVVELDGYALEERSIAAVAALGLSFAAVTWGIAEDLGAVRLARIDPYPRADQLFPVWNDVGPALLKALRC